MLNRSERYKKFYSEKWLEKYSFWHELMRGMINSQIDSILGVLKSINKSKIKILDAGCGAGDVINGALKQLKEKEIKLTANDTSEEILKKYRFINRAHNPQTICGEMEELPKRVTSKFDLILFSHSLYGVSLEVLFEDYLRLLNPCGFILIFLTSRSSDTIRISERFWPKVHGCDYDETLAEEVMDKMNQLKLNYSIKEFKQEVDFDKLRIIDEGGIKNLLVPFLFRLEKFNEKDEIKNYIDSLYKKRKIYNIVKAITIMT